ncbi:beta-ketoacyl-ACP synthase 3 [Amorphoplanes digitatis]|uniref:3-oxoacyl-[acyl-carrier-protein] synthase-3 n=1 Tax=Actinoplanes digitatis TaxID=1868 RepID=A0A7W7HYW6_9ACTN|nr:beta-ketoacyl-ACP synthase 3 [Actinoplanes digitatis]MBB4763333.1 3-oxoacyl-[acyl-carrier-protein] synthase-3 [Actinoplanes digitatis]GID92151.1 3-oxoacyl-[acyl-carrier-protein] synthase 3 protein 3 [Actinoplanes digitatis]
MSRVAVLEGLGTAVPSRRVPNTELAPALEVTDDWIRRRTGIAERRVVEPGTTTADLASTAGRNALKSAQVDNVDAVVVATTTPDRMSPATAPEVAWRVGVAPAAAFDLAAVCSGFVYGLAACAGLIAAGIAERVLLIGAETNSYFLQHVPQARGPAILFGDGAGAVVLRAGTADEPGAIGPFDLGSDGGAADLIRIESGGSRQRARAAAAEPSAKEAPEDLYWSVSGQEVYRRAIEHMTQSSLRVLRAAGRTVADLDRFVAHQANQRILDRVAELVGVDVDRRIGNVATVGNTGAASIPLALGDACRAGLLRAGHRLLATSFGGGLTWGSALLTWPALDAVATEQ